MKSVSVYVIGDPGGQMKIGHSADVLARLHELRKQRKPLELVFVQQFGWAAGLRIERLAHQLLAAHRVHGEWFAVTPAQAVAAVEEAIARDRAGSGQDEKVDWTIPSVRRSTKRAAVKAARLEGLTTAAWLERKLMEHGHAAPGEGEGRA